MAKNKSKKLKAIPLAPPPMKSRKRARVVTTLFHKYTRERDEALHAGDSDKVKELEQKIDDMGGRQEYQRASQLNTSIFSTSKWVMSVLHKLNLLPRGISLHGQQPTTNPPIKNESTSNDNGVNFRPIKLLEVGAINTQLLDAADNPKLNLEVKAIDLQSSHEERIEEKDFFLLPLLDGSDVHKRYDVIVCSMVINCVTTPEDRGKMLFLLKRHLRPGGICFLTLPLLCLMQSQYMSKGYFNRLLTEAAGFQLLANKETPKIAFYVLSRSLTDHVDNSFEDCLQTINNQWKHVPTLNRGKKYRNKFAVVFATKQTNPKSDNGA